MKSLAALQVTNQSQMENICGD